MRKTRFVTRSLAAVALLAAGLSGWLAVAAPSAQEPALALTHDDPSLAWGPCPDFMPEGCSIAVLHGDPAQPNVDLLFKAPAGADLPEHWHTSPERMVLLAGELHVTYRGQETVVLRAGTYAYGPARRPHTATCVSDVPCVLFIAFESPVDAVPGAGD